MRTGFLEKKKAGGGEGKKKVQNYVKGRNSKRRRHRDPKPPNLPKGKQRKGKRVTKTQTGDGNNSTFGDAQKGRGEVESSIRGWRGKGLSPLLQGEDTGGRRIGTSKNLLRR